MNKRILQFTIQMISTPTRADLTFMHTLDQAIKNNEFPDIFTKAIGSLSRKKIKSWFQSQEITWNHQILTPSTLLPCGLGRFTCTLQDESLLRAFHANPSTKGCFLPILYEDADILVLNKQSGIPSAPQSPDDTETAVGSALAHHPALKTIGTHPLEPGLLHRLDTGTSGILIFAKTNEEWARLLQIWKQRRIQKYYRAWIYPTQPLSPMPFLIHQPLAHPSRSSKKMIALHQGDRQFHGKPLPAQTILLRMHAALQYENILVNDIEIQIITGVMHQIRCHLAHFKWPILGDTLYRGHPSTRLWLHAWRVTLPLKSKQLLDLEAPLPDQWLLCSTPPLLSFLSQKK